MKLLFSEAHPDYGHYIFPYAVWAFPEPGETPADLFRHGFLPSSRNLDRFYLCRHLRVNLRRFALSSENRRILRKGQGIEQALVARSEFEYGAARREFFKDYADRRFGRDVMTYERLDGLFAGKVTTHAMVFTDAADRREVGVVTLYLQPQAMAYYSYAFYDLGYSDRNLGLYMMTAAVCRFAELGFEHLYLGTCYLASAMYKTQFKGIEFFNGVRWSENLAELKHLVRRGQVEQPQHLLESMEYRAEFLQGLEPAALGAVSVFRGETR